ncbi:MAG: hypothetical protein H6707_07070 [Deltaproteobacteria bacterium]|nr:hypothetical protein [Deltaproteobacteria bacterium]
MRRFALLVGVFYASLMSDDDKHDQIAKLEAQVAELQARLDRQIVENEGVTDGEEASWTPPKPASRGRLIAFGITVVVVVGALLMALFIALSAGFDKVADKAAGAFVPKAGAEQGPASTPAERQKKPPQVPENLRVPGL